MNDLEGTENKKTKKYQSKSTETSEERNTLQKKEENNKNTSEYSLTLEENFDYLSQKENFKVKN